MARNKVENQSKNSSMKVYVVKYLIKTTKKDEAWLEKEFGLARRFQIALIKDVRKRLSGYKNDSRVKDVFSKYKTDKASVTAADKKILNEVANIYGIGYKYALHNFNMRYRELHEDALMARTAIGIETNVYKALWSCLYKKGKKINIPSEVSTLSDDSGKMDCIKYINGYVKYSYKTVKKTDGQGRKYTKTTGLKAKIHIDKNDTYRQDALRNTPGCTKIQRVKTDNGTYRYYLVLTFKEKIPTRTEASPVGTVGIDLGTSTVAVAGDNGQVILEELGHNLPDNSRELRLLNRKMDRQRRINNPDNYNEDGTIKKGRFVEINGKKVRKRLKWVNSKGYFQTKNKYAALMANRATRLKQSQEMLANRVVEMGDKFHIEESNIKALMKRSNKTEISDKTGRFKKKGRFGKSILLHAPGQFEAILESKLKAKGLSLDRVNTRSMRASQYNHITSECVKKHLSMRWAHLDEANGIKVQRDLYSAFILKNADSELKLPDAQKCIDGFDTFKAGHDEEINRLQGLITSGEKFPSCMGLKKSNV